MKICIHLRIRNFDNLEEDLEFIMPQDRILDGTILDMAASILSGMVKLNFVEETDVSYFSSLPLATLLLRENFPVPILIESSDISDDTLSYKSDINNQTTNAIKVCDKVREENSETVYYDVKEVDEQCYLDGDGGGDQTIVVKMDQQEGQLDDSDHVEIDEVQSITDSTDASQKSYKVRKKKVPIDDKKTERISKSDNFMCDVCYRVFTRKADLENHVRVHDDSKPFICSVCGKSFRQLALLLRHGQVEHENKKSFDCSTCGKSFGYKRVLIEHMRVHSGEKPFKCDLCEQRFTQRSNMKKHMKLNHSTTRDFKCDECSKQFVSGYYLKRHLATVHKMHVIPEEANSSIRSTRCPFCTVTTKTQASLEEHISTFHSDYTT